MGTSAWDLAPDFIVLIVSHNLYPDQPSFSTLAEMDKVIEEGREIFLFFVEKKNLFHLTVFFLNYVTVYHRIINSPWYKEMLERSEKYCIQALKILKSAAQILN